MSSPVQPPLRVETVDGTISGRPITTIKVTNGDLTVSGSTATIDTSGGGGGTGTVTSVGSSQAFITITSATTTPSISIGNASGAATGVLTASDFNTFDAKQDAITLTTTGTSGAATFSGGTLNIPQYSATTGTVTSVALTKTGTALTITGSPITGSGTFEISGAGTSSQVILGDLSLGTLTSGTVTGTGSANQVSYWTSASAQAGSTGLTYDPSTGNLTVGGYVETGTKVTTSSGTNLTLDTNNGTDSGSIVIAEGVNGQIVITPNGTGTIKLDGVELDNSLIQTGYVLKATSATGAGWAAESGGGGITFPIEADNGSASAPSYSFSGDTDTGIYLSGASSMGIAAGGQNYLFIGSLGAVQFNKKALFNAATAAAPNGFATDTNTGFFQPSADTIGFSTAGTERLRFGSSGEILVGGTASGTSGQVLTSGGSGSAVSWTTPSGGGGGGLKIPNSFGTTLTGTFGDGECLGLSFGLGAVGSITPNSASWANGLTRIRPHIMMQTGTLSTAKIWINAQPTGGVDQDWIIGLWNMGTDNKVGTLKATATIICLEGGSTGITSGTWTAETGENLSVVNGESYFIGYYSIYGASSTAVKVYFCPQSSITSYPARRPNANTGSTSNACRVYGSAGSPSSLGDNPVMTGADTASTSAWPLMWYEVT